MPNIHFVPECNAETEMVKLLFDIRDNDYLNHAEGIHSVSRILEKEDVATYTNIGFVDNDKKNLPFYFDRFNVVAQTPEVIIKKHPETNDYLFFANPAIERFLLLQLVQINKQPSDFGLPNDFKLFRNLLKKQRIKHHEGYKQMILELKDANTSGIAFIRNHVQEFIDQKP